MAIEAELLALPESIRSLQTGRESRRIILEGDFLPCKAFGLLFALFQSLSLALSLSMFSLCLIKYNF